MYEWKKISFRFKQILSQFLIALLNSCEPKYLSPHCKIVRTDMITYIKHAIALGGESTEAFIFVLFYLL